MAVDPVQYIPTTQGKSQNQIASENSIKMQREIAAALMAQQTKANPFYTWANGLNDMSAKIMGGMEARNADQREAARNMFHAGNDSQFQGGQGGAPTPAPFTVSQGSTGPNSGLSDFIQQQEGFRPTPYADGKQTSIGYGTRAQGPNDRVDEAEGKRRLQTELAPAAAFVNRNFPNAPDRIKTALTDLTYNTGTKWATAGLGQAVRAGDYQTAGQLFQQYNHANGQVLPGLTARRQAMAPAFGGGQQGGMLGAPAPTAPTMLAQVAPGRQPPGNMQSDFANYLYQRGGPGNSPPLSPEEAFKFRMGTQPNYDVGEFGQITRSAPGEIPTSMGIAPNHPGKIEYNKDYGTFNQIKMGPDGKPSVTIIPPTVPKMAPGGTAPNAPVATPTAPATRAPETPKTAPTAPKTAPAGGINAPVTPTAPPKGILAAEPPGGVPPVGIKAGSKLAMADIDPMAEAAVSATGKPSKLSELTTKDDEPPEIDLNNPTTPETQAARKWLDWADANPTTPPRMPNLLDQAMKEGTADAFRNLTHETEVQKKALEDETKAQNKGFAELQKAFRDSHSQALKLSPELKLAKRLIESPDFHTGPAHKTVELARGLRNELGQLVDDLAKDYKGKPLPGWLQSARDYLKDPENREATANQVFTKILSGSILQSLRGMLGPNSGQFRMMELSMLRDAFGNPNLTKDANRVVMSMIDKINDRNILIGEMADHYVAKHRKLDASFERGLARFERENPAFSKNEYDEFIKLTHGGAPAGSTAPAAPTHSREDLEKEMRRRGFIK